MKASQGSSMTFSFNCGIPSSNQIFPQSIQKREKVNSHCCGWSGHGESGGLWHTPLTLNHLRRICRTKVENHASRLIIPSGQIHSREYLRPRLDWWLSGFSVLLVKKGMGGRTEAGGRQCSRQKSRWQRGGRKYFGEILLSPCYSLDLCILLGIPFPFSFAFASLLFSATHKAFWDNHFAFLHFFFLGMVLVTTSCTMLWIPIHSSSGTLSLPDLVP